MLLFNPYAGFPSDALLLLLGMWLLLLLSHLIRLGVVGLFMRTSFKVGACNERSCPATSVLGKYIFFSTLVLFILLCHLWQMGTKRLTRYLILNTSTKQFLLERDIFCGRVLGFFLLIYCAMTMCTCSEKYVTAPARKTVVILPCLMLIFSDTSTQENNFFLFPFLSHIMIT